MQLTHFSLSHNFFLIIFFWTPLTFWALSLYKSDDYKKAKIPMLPLTNGIESTKINILVYSLLMLPVIILPYAIDFVGLIFLVPALCLLYIIIIYVLSFIMLKRINLIQKSKINIWIFNFIFIFDICYFFDR